MCRIQHPESRSPATKSKPGIRVEDSKVTVKTLAGNTQTRLVGSTVSGIFDVFHWFVTVRFGPITLLTDL